MGSKLIPSLIYYSMLYIILGNEQMCVSLPTVKFDLRLFVWTSAAFMCIYDGLKVNKQLSKHI